MTSWTDEEMTDQTGRVAFVTGATSGLGLRCAIVLAGHGARVLMGFRHLDRAKRALAEVCAVASAAEPELVPLDLTKPASIAQTATGVRERANGRLDLLVNNAGIMAPPLTITAAGFESQWATNVLGPVALTWSLLSAVMASPRGRVVTVTSIAHIRGAFDPTTIDKELRGEGYQPVPVYCHTKLADLVFARELHRRLESAGSSTLSVAAHPGMAETNIAANTVRRAPEAVRDFVVSSYNLPAQPARTGALPILFAATFPGMRGGYLIAPRGPLQLRGRPTARPGSALSRNLRFAARTWRMLERATGLESPI